MKKLLLVSIVLAQIMVGAQARTGTVSGLIRNVDGSPAVGVRVTAIASDTVYLSLAESDENGRYRLENIPPGRCYIVAGRIDLPTYYPGTTNRSSARDISVAAGAVIGDVDFILDPASWRLPGTPPAPTIPTRRVAGRFIIEGLPTNPTPVISSGRIRAERVSDGLAVTMESGPDGAFNLRLEDGDYRIRITPPRGYAVKSALFDSIDLARESMKVDSSIRPVPARPNGVVIVPPRELAATTSPEIVITLVRQNIL